MAGSKLKVMSSEPKNHAFTRVSLITKNKNIYLVGLNIFKLWEL